ncbi:MAG: hypothetical protein AB1646_11850 [Thermodesulfobacteriota bacterium]
MKNNDKHADEGEERDTMRPEYDFSGAVRGVTAARYAEGTNVGLIAPDVIDLFPDSESVNDALRALAHVIRRREADFLMKGFPRETF